MKFIQYINNRSNKLARHFSDNYYMTVDSELLEELSEELSIEENKPTAAMLKTTDSDFDEMWVTFDSNPYHEDAKFTRVTRYMRDAKYVVVWGKRGHYCSSYEQYSTKQEAIRAYITEIKLHIGAGYPIHSGVPTMHAVKTSLSTGLVHSTEYGDGHFISVEEYRPL